jgi:hypothetical protein
MRQGQAAATAPGRGQEAEPVPAVGAQAAGRVDLDAAAQAARRQNQIKSAGTDAAKQREIERDRRYPENSRNHAQSMR